MKDIAILIVSLGIILLGAEMFTNGIEWLGKRLKLSDGAVGSVLAAVGTALPETMVPVIAFVGGDGAGKSSEVGIGAVLGAPFMLATLAFFIAGLSVKLFRKNNRPMTIDSQVMSRDLTFFLIVYTIAILASFLPVVLKKFAAVFLVAAYVVYVVQTVRASSGGQQGYGELVPLYLARKSQNPPIMAIGGQVLLALLAIVAGAHGFVGAVQAVALRIGIPVLELSLIITPIATELPEKFNSVLWIRHGKDTLAMGNLTGAMVFQSSVIPAIGIVLTPWQLTPLALWSAILALGATMLPFISLKRRGQIFSSNLLLAGVFYLLFILTVTRFPSY